MADIQQLAADVRAARINFGWRNLKTDDRVIELLAAILDNQPNSSHAEGEIGISYDPGPLQFAKIDGPGGFTQIPMPLYKVRALACVLGVELVMCKPGTTIPDEAI